MPAFTRVFSVLLFLFYFTIPHNIYSYFTDDFDGGELDSNTWISYTNSGQIVNSDGFLWLKRSVSASNSFPYIHSKGSIFPESGAFSLEIKFQYTDTGNFGDAITISADSVPVNGINPDTNLYKYMAFMIYQDRPNGLSFGKILCNKDSSSCQSREFIRPFSHNPDYDTHTVLVDYTELGEYKIFIDQGDHPDYVSAPDQRRPKHIWLGNSMITNSSDHFSSIKVDYIKISTPIKFNLPIIVIPGMGGSWDMPAIKNGVPGMDWKIPSFVKSYDSLLLSLENAGYTRDKDLFVFGYDWRKPIDQTSDDLRKFIIGKNLDDKKINLVGHSMGGLVARIYAQKYGVDNIGKIIMAGSPNLGAVEAYGIWEGKEYWKDVWSIKAGIEIASHIKLPGESDIDALRKNVPSLRDVLPTFDFLLKDQAYIPTSLMKQQNTYMKNMNSSADFGLLPVHVILGVNKQTLESLRVQNRNHTDRVMGLWEDGKPTRSPFIYGDGDNTVLSSSALGGFGNKYNIDEYHYPLLANSDGIGKVFEILELDKSKIEVVDIDSKFLSERVFVVLLKSPGVLEVCNNENVCDDALGIYDDRNKVFMLPGYANENLVVRVKPGDGVGSYILQMADIDKKAVWSDIKGYLKDKPISYNVIRGSIYPKEKQDCFLYGWRKYSHLSFRNQGMCISYLNRPEVVKSYLDRKYHD